MPTHNTVQDPSVYNFPVALRPVFDDDGNEIPRVKNVKRLDTRQPLSIVSDRYRLIKHETMVGAFEPFTTALGVHTTRFYQEKHGARVIMENVFQNITMRVPGHNIPGQRTVGDVVALKVYGVNSYNTTTPLILRVGCLVLRCLNGATAFESIFGLNVKHVGREEPEISLPDPAAVVSVFRETGKVWEEWADLVLTREDKETLVEEGPRWGIASESALKKEEARFNAARTVWDLYNAFTYVVTHQTRKIQETGRLNRFDRLNGLFNAHYGKQI